MTSAKKNVTEIVGEIVELLSPLDSEERTRVVRASLTLLGEKSISSSVGGIEEAQEEMFAGFTSLPIRARSWLKQNDIASEQLQQIFNFTGDGVEVIAASGKNNRERVRNAYVLLGIARLFASGDAKFDDKSARALCEHLGIYDHTNHMKYMKGGNEFTGTKDKGWALTAPGLKRGAALVKESRK